MDSTLQAVQEEVFYVGPALGVVVGTLFLSFILGAVWWAMAGRKQRFDLDRIREKYGTVVVSALLGVPIISLTQLSQTSPDKFLLVSTYGFAIAIPVLTAYVALYRDVTTRKYDVEGGHQRLPWAGLISATIGVASLFWHFSYIVGVVFLIASGIAFGWFAEWQQIVQTLNQQYQDDSEKTAAEQE